MTAGISTRFRWLASRPIWAAVKSRRFDILSSGSSAASTDACFSSRSSSAHSIARSMSGKMREGGFNRSEGVWLYQHRLSERAPAQVSTGSAASMSATMWAPVESISVTRLRPRRRPSSGRCFYVDDMGQPLRSAKEKGSLQFDDEIEAPFASSNSISRASRDLRDRTASQR